MAKRISFFSALFFTLCTAAAWSQVKKESINQLIENYKRTVNTQPDSAFFYINKAIVNSKKNNDTFLFSSCLYHLGCYYYLKNDQKKSTQYFNKAIDLARKSKNFKTEALSFNQLSAIDMDNGNYNESLKKLLAAKNITEKNNLLETQCFILNNLGILFETQGDSINAVDYYTQNLKIASKHNFKVNILSAYVNIALLIKKKQKQKAIDFLIKAKNISREIKNTNEEFAILINLSYVYSSIGTQTNDAKSFQCLLDAKKIVATTGDSEKLFFVNFNLGNYFLKQKSYPKAIGYYNESLAVSEKNIPEEQKQKLYAALADVYKLSGNYEKAFLFKEKYYAKKDSIFTIEKDKSFREIQTKYEVEKKNLKIDLLTKQKEIESNKKQKIISIGILIIVSLLFLIFFFKNRITIQKKLNQQEQKLKRIQGLIEGQNQERNRIAKEIHDGVGEKLIGIKMKLASASSESNKSKIEPIIDSFSSVFQEIRSISHNLSSNHIDGNTLIFLLNELQSDINKRDGFALEVSVFPPEKSNSLTKELKHQLYRIIQELLSNITKHANAKNAGIALTFYDDTLNLVVEDDGNGFKNEVNGIGLMNIKERLLLLNGTMEIDQSPESGTTVIIDIPIKSN